MAKKSNPRSVTLDEFDELSRATADFIRSFGQSTQIKDDLFHIANLGADATLWIEPWADKIVVARSYEQPVSVRPWKDHPAQEISGRCANLCGAWLMAACWSIVFKENPPFKKLHGLGNFINTVEPYIEKNLPDLSKQAAFILSNANYPEWLKLAETMEIERVHLLAAFRPKPSPALPREKWIHLLDISMSSFERGIENGDFTVLSKKRGRWVLDINKLPPKMQAPTYFDSVLNVAKTSPTRHENVT